MNVSSPRPSGRAGGIAEVSVPYDSETYHISRLVELKAVSDAVRLSVLRLLVELGGEKGLSSRELSDATGIAPTLMQYHLKILRDADLVRVVARKSAQGRREREYRAAWGTLRWDFP